MSECLFCKMVSRDITADVVFDKGNVLAFRDINPQAPTHILLIPKEHVKDVSELDGSRAGLLAELIAAANELARSEGIDSTGYRLVANVGPEAGQTVFHLHLHLLGGRPMGWPPG
jgi:histidine triad (HIT) family protein